MLPVTWARRHGRDRSSLPGSGLPTKSWPTLANSVIKQCVVSRPLMITMLSLATNALHYFRYRVGLDQAKTQTTEAERRLFQEIAPGRKVIVELGVFEGVSSRLFRGAMDSDAELYGVDPFPVGRLLFSPQHAISARE